MSGTLMAELDTDDLSMVKVTFTHNKKSMIKTISKEDFIKLMKTREEEAEEKRLAEEEAKNLFELKLMPRFPEGTVDVQWYDKDNFFVSVLVPGQVRPTSYMNKEMERLIPFPSLLFGFRISKRALIHSACFAVKETRARNISKSTELYRFPYGNVYQDGRICWGSTGIARDIYDNGMSAIPFAIETFFNATMNNDLYHDDVTKKKVSLELLLFELEEKDIFPSSILVKSGVTYDTYLSRVK